MVKDGSDVIMRMVEDFGLMSESDSEDEQPENLHHQVVLRLPICVAMSDLFVFLDVRGGGGEK